MLHEFVEQVFGPSQFEAHPLLRGVYFVSGTQEGTPIDRDARHASRAPTGSSAACCPRTRRGGKSYFLSRLLREVVFAESALAGTDLKWERRRGWLAAAGYGAVGVVAAAALAAWITSYQNNRDYVAQVGAAVDELRKLVRRDAESRSPPMSPCCCRRSKRRTTSRAPVSAIRCRCRTASGCTRAASSTRRSQRAYQRMLADAMLPRLALRIEEQLKTGAGNPELHYEALKAYLMLYDPQRFDAAALKLYVMADWEANLPREVSTEQRAALEAHLDALLAEGQVVSPLQVEDKNLVAQTRARLASTPLARTRLPPHETPGHRHRHRGLHDREQGRQRRRPRLSPRERRAADEGRAGHVHARRLPQGIPARGDARVGTARRRAGLGARHQRSRPSTRACATRWRNSGSQTRCAGSTSPSMRRCGRHSSPTSS